MPEVSSRFTWLFPWFMCLALIIVGVSLSLTPIAPDDFWWHLRVGQLVMTEGIPTTNRFAWTVPATQPYVYGEWLGGYLLYLLYEYGGPAAPVIMRNLLGLLTMLLFARRCVQRTNSWLLSAGLVLAAGLLTSTNMALRPQIWAWLPCMAFLWVVHPPPTVPMPTPSGRGSSDRLPQIPSWHQLLLLPPLMVFWVNVHGSFVLGLLILGVAVLGSIATPLRQRRPLPWRPLLPLLGTSLACGVATLINPHGPGIYAYLWAIATNPTIHTIIQEWHPPMWNKPIGLSFYLSVILISGASILRWRRLTITDELLLMVFLALALSAQRAVFWWALVALPIFGQLVTPSVPTPDTASRRRMRRQQRQGINRMPPPLPATDVPRRHGIAMGSLLLLVFILVQPPLRSHLPLLALSRESVIDVPGAPASYSRDTPVRAVDYLRQHPLPGPIFNESGIGSYLIWAVGERLPVFIDPRVELFPPALWHDYMTISRGAQLDELLITKYQVTRVILNRDYQEGLAVRIATNPHWVLEYSDGLTDIYRRVTP